ncbi:MAG: MarR family transcriptional regulator [Anaerolineaceae bacterium]|nr:MarR family transcriptional regulator [Anaerolineaceae bacterium]
MGTKYQGTEAEVLALDTYIKVTRAAQSVTDRAMEHLGESNLTPSQFAILEALYHLGTLSQVELAQKLLLSTGNITTVIQNLEKRNLVCRQRSTSDQRYMQVSITDEGRQLIARIFPSHVAGIVDIMNVLTAEEQQTLAQLSRKLGLGQ